MTLSRRNLLKTAGLSSLAFVPLSQASAAGFDKEYDIVIIGAGGAGLAAACRAGELGLKAIVLEKNLKDSVSRKLLTPFKRNEN